jgi:hypothetical protein
MLYNSRAEVGFAYCLLETAPSEEWKSNLVKQRDKGVVKDEDTKEIAPLVCQQASILVIMKRICTVLQLKWSFFDKTIAWYHTYLIIKGFLDFVHRPDSKELEDKNTTFRKLDLFPSSGEWLRLALSKGPNRVDVSPHLRTAIDPVSETSCFYLLDTSNMNPDMELILKEHVLRTSKRNVRHRFVWEQTQTLNPSERSVPLWWALSRLLIS